MAGVLKHAAEAAGTAATALQEAEAALTALAGEDFTMAAGPLKT